MSTIVTLNSVSYQIPATGEDGWGDAVSAYLIALSSGILTKAGGAFTLTADIDFGTNFGIKAKYLKSRTADIAVTGLVRLAPSDFIAFRNNANTADLTFGIDGSDLPTFGGSALLTGALASGRILLGDINGVAQQVTPSGDIGIDNTGVTFIGSGKVQTGMIATGAVVDASIGSAAAIAFSKLATLTSANILVGSASNVATSVAVSGDITLSNAGVTAIGSSKVTNNMLAGSIAYSKLVLTGAILNADLAGSIAYSKLVLTGSVTNSDLAGSIAYGKLTLTNSVVNADIASAAAIVYSKLSLTGSILNADVNASAAIAYSKLALTGAIVNADISSSAAIAYSKLSLASSVKLASDVTGTLPIANGGTGQTTATLAINALLPTQTSNNGKVLTTDGSVASWTTATGLTNPMTTSQDIIVGGSAGAATRKAIGADGTVLLAASGTLTYSQIVDANISSGAAIAYSKLALTGNIVNADINASAAIAGTKISPAFGTQNISTTGTLSLASTTVINSAVKTADTLAAVSFGTWTPVSRYGTSNGTKSDSGAVGQWMRIGKFMFVSWEIVPLKGTAVGAVFIGGLPMAATASSSFTPGTVTNVGFSAATSQLIYTVASGSSEFAVTQMVTATAQASINAADLGVAGAALYGSGMYCVA